MDLYRSGCVPDGKKEAPSQYGGNMNRLFALEFFTGFRCIVQQIGKEHDHIRYIQWQCGKIVHLKVDADPFFDRFGRFGIEERVEDRVDGGQRVGPLPRRRRRRRAGERRVAEGRGRAGTRWIEPCSIAGMPRLPFFVVLPVLMLAACASGVSDTV